MTNVTLWTRQDERSLEELKKNKVFVNKEEYIRNQYEDIADHFIKLYKWFVKEASKKVPKPDYVSMPIWCSISRENMYRPIEGSICYELQVPEEEIIYFDGQKWDYVLNHLYIPKDEKDHENYLHELRLKGFKNEFEFFVGPNAHFYPEERNKIISSWIRIFDIEEWNIFRVQANIWQIKEEYVKEIYYAR